MNSMKRLSDWIIALDCLVCGNNPDKPIEIRSELTGKKVHSIKLDGVYYYPQAMYNPKKHI